MQLTTLRLAVLAAGSALLPLSGFCASLPAMPFPTSLNQAPVAANQSGNTSVTSAITEAPSLQTGNAAGTPVPAGDAIDAQAAAGEGTDAPAVTGDATSALMAPAASSRPASSRVIEGQVVRTVTGAHDTEGVLHILPVASSGEAAGMAFDVPNNASIQRSDEVEKVSGESGIAFFRHIHVGDVVAIAYSQVQDGQPAATQNVADKIEILHRR